MGRSRFVNGRIISDEEELGAPEVKKPKKKPTKKKKPKRNSRGRFV